MLYVYKIHICLIHLNVKGISAYFESYCEDFPNEKIIVCSAVPYKKDFYVQMLDQDIRISVEKKYPKSNCRDWSPKYETGLNIIIDIVQKV